MPRRARRAQGFTMTEMIVATALFLGISLLAAATLSGTSNLWWTSNTQGEVRIRAQQGLNRMVSELRSCTRSAGASPPNISIPAAPNNTSLTLYLPADIDGNGRIIDATGATEWDTLNPIRYVYVPAQRQLQRQRGAAVQVLANDVQNVTFEDASITPSLYQNEAKITLTLQKTTPQGRSLSATAVEIVKLRN